MFARVLTDVSVRLVNVTENGGLLNQMGCRQGSRQSWVACSQVAVGLLKVEGD